MRIYTAVASLLFVASLICFVLGFIYPIMSSDVFMGLVHEQKIHLTDTITLLWEKGAVFLASLILVFSIVFPVLKYLVVGLKLAHLPYPGHKQVGAALDLINKWAMLDVFVVALIIINMKTGHSLVFSMNLEAGINFFAGSIVLLMICNWILKRRIVAEIIHEVQEGKTPTPEVADLPKSEGINAEDSSELS